MSSSYRFSSDTATIDAKLSVQVSHVLKHLTSIVVVMVVQAIAVPWALPVLAPALIVYGVVQGYYRRTSREIQRLDSVAKSPVLNVRRVAAGRPNLCSARTLRTAFVGNAYWSHQYSGLRCPASVLGRE